MQALNAHPLLAGKPIFLASFRNTSVGNHFLFAKVGLPQQDSSFDIV